jgi:hypothetical protein
LISRFLHRPSLQATLDTVRIDGFLVYSHFLDGCQHTAVGTPSSPDGFLLKGELEVAVEEAGFVILECVYTSLPDGRPIVELLARRCR